MRAPCEKSGAHVFRLAGIPSTERELIDFKRGVRDDLFAISGLRAHGVGVCCSEMPGARCLSIFLDPCGPPIDEVVRRIAELKERDSAIAYREMLIRVDLTHPGPRCQPDDASCGPLSIGVPTDPDMDRFPISRPQGYCSHDGECAIGGCAEGSCLSWREAARQWICALSSTSGEPPNMPRACGCVAGACRWFEQDGATESSPTVAAP